MKKRILILTLTFCSITAVWAQGFKTISRIHFITVDTIALNSNSWEVIALPASDSLIGYDHTTFFPLFKVKGTDTLCKGIRFSTYFTSPIRWSVDNQYLLTGLETYDWKRKIHSTRNWTYPLINFLAGPDYKHLSHSWRINNAQWSPGMKSVVIFSGYYGNSFIVPEKFKYNEKLNWLILADSAGKKMLVLDELYDYDSIEDMEMTDTLLVVSGQHEIKWWNLKHPIEKHTLLATPGNISEVHIHAKLSIAAVTDDDGNLFIWNTLKPDSVKKMHICNGTIYEAMFHPSLPLLFTIGKKDLKVRCWQFMNSEIQEIPITLQEENAGPAGFDNQGRIFLRHFHLSEKYFIRYSLQIEN